MEYTTPTINARKYRILIQGNETYFAYQNSGETHWIPIYESDVPPSVLSVLYANLVKEN